VADEGELQIRSPGYNALTERFALFELERTLFHVHGDRAYRVVNGLVTNSFDQIEDGRGCYAFALTAKGRPIAEMRVLPAPAAPGSSEHLWIDAPVTAAPGLRDLFTRTVPPIFATVNEPAVRRLSIAGAGAMEALPAILDAAGVPTDSVPGPLEARTFLPEDGAVGAGLIVGREAIETPGVDIFVPEDLAGALLDRLAKAVLEAGGDIATPEDWEVVRVERGLPAYGAEITIENLPQETGQTERAISFDKGCYTGQEVVARLHYRGHVNRVLRGLCPLDPEAALSAEALLYRDGRKVGQIGTVVSSPRLGSLGLGYIRTAVEPGETVATGPDATPDVRVVELPFTQ